DVHHAAVRVRPADDGVAPVQHRRDERAGTSFPGLRLGLEDDGVLPPGAAVRESGARRRALQLSGPALLGVQRRLGHRARPPRARRGRRPRARDHGVAGHGDDGGPCPRFRGGGRPVSGRFPWMGVGPPGASSQMGASGAARRGAERRSARPPARRLLVALVFLAVVTAIGTVGYTVLEGLPPADAFYLTIVTLTTVGYGDLVPYTDLRYAATSVTNWW